MRVKNQILSILTEAQKNPAPGAGTISTLPLETQAKSMDEVTTDGINIFSIPEYTK